MFPVILLAFLAADATSNFVSWNAGLAYKQLDRREAEVRAVTSRDQAEARKKIVRERLLQVLNGLPDYHGPLNAQVSGVIDMGAYRIEKLTYESWPGFLVTANLYLPKARGRHPAVLYPIGHWDEGKAFGQMIGGNLAKKGFVVLTYDPIGQGERQQADDARTGRSLIGGSVEQHILNGATSALIGDGLARYWVFEGMRSLDYLGTRDEVDSARIGCTGCSGGGMTAAFLSALDPRIKVAAPSCYMQTFRTLITGEAGDSEQSNPGFLAAGLDQADFAELFSPKPWMLTSTEQDFFTLAGARPVYEEARRWYGLYDAGDRIKWAIGPGPHGTPKILREAIYDWMIRWIGDDPKRSSAEEDVRLMAVHEFNATPSGHTNPQSVDLSRLIQERMLNRFSAGGDLIGYLKQGTSESEPDMELNARIIPPKGTPTGNGVLLVETTPSKRGEDLSESGDTVMVVVPRGLPAAAGYPYNLPYPGEWKTNVLALLVGRNLPLLRARDILSAADKLAATPGVQRIVRAEASGVSGYWLLAAAVLDKRIESVRLERTPWSIRGAFSAALTRDLYQAAMYGFSLHWDTADLLKAIEPRKVTWLDPTDWNRNVIPVTGAIYEYTKSHQ